jgi:hypothetical protein
MTSARTGSIVLLASLFALSACGSSAKKVDPAADLALAKRAVLTKADLPGFESSPHTADDDLPADLKKTFDACLKVTTSLFDTTPGAQSASSDDFSKGQEQISGNAKIYPKQDLIDAHFKALADSGTGACLQKLFDAAARDPGSGGPAVKISNESVSQFAPGVGPHSVGYEVKLTLTLNKQTATFFADVIFLQRDRAGLDFEFVDIGAAPDRTFATSLVQKSYDRIGKDAA